MKIYLIRHGLTYNNKIGKLNGQRRDEPLEPEGILQAEEAVQTLPEGITKLYVSPMVRTMQTAEILNKKLNLDMIPHPNIKEVDFGTLTDRSWKDIIDEHGADIRNSYVGQTYDFTHLDGESAELVKNRVSEFLNEIKTNHPNEKILVVTHGGILRAMYRMYHNKEIEGAENASVHEFEI